MTNLLYSIITTILFWFIYCLEKNIMHPMRTLLMYTRQHLSSLISAMYGRVSNCNFNCASVSFHTAGDILSVVESSD